MRGVYCINNPNSSLKTSRRLKDLNKSDKDTSKLLKKSEKDYKNAEKHLKDAEKVGCPM